MSLITVKWRAESEEYGMSTIGWQESLLPDWADCEANSESAIKDITEDYFDEYEWRRWFGEGDNASWRSPDILVEIVEPESIAGRYEVCLELRPRASVARFP